jgi:hypothetical protein
MKSLAFFKIKLFSQILFLKKKNIFYIFKNINLLNRFSLPKFFHFYLNFFYNLKKKLWYITEK